MNIYVLKMLTVSHTNDIHRLYVDIVLSWKAKIKVLTLLNEIHYSGPPFIPHGAPFFDDMDHFSVVVDIEHFGYYYCKHSRIN